MADCCCGVFRHEPGCPIEDRLVELTAHVDAGPLDVVCPPGQGGA